MAVIGAALHALGTEWSAKLYDMYKRANKSLVLNCRYLEMVKLTDLWVPIKLNSFNFVESLLLTEGERQCQGAYSTSWGPTLEQIACLREPRIPSHAYSTVRQTGDRGHFVSKNYIKIPLIDFSLLLHRNERGYGPYHIIRWTLGSAN